MKSLFSAACLYLGSVTVLVSADDNGGMIQLHGSGTTNPSKCYWRIMDQMMARSKLPLHMTYRAVGSSTGIFEFMGVNNTDKITGQKYKSFNDFGSGDIPVPSDDYQALKANNVEMAHFPFVLGAISLFHSIPGFDNDGNNGLNLTSCDIARIFKREILYWDDEELKKDNPNMVVPYANYPIKVAHRGKGSSSTASFTEYLHLTCPEEWPLSSVGSKIEWASETFTCEGSGGMTDCIRDAPGTIGYIDSGHGHSENLVEIELKNADGVFLNSKVAGANGIKRAALQALDEGIVPKVSTDDYGAVKLLNKPGRNTWPMVAMTYVFVRTDLTTVVTDPRSQSLLKYFLKSLYDPEVIGMCQDYGFTPVPSRVADIALEGIANIKMDDAAPEWSTEVLTNKGAGQGDYVISAKRRTYVELRSSNTAGDFTGMMTEMDALKKEIAYLKERKPLEENGKADAAYALAIISMVLWCLLIFYTLLKACGIIGGGYKEA